MSTPYLMSRMLVLSVSLASAMGAAVWADAPQSAGAASTVSREEAEALVADDPAMTPLEREGFVNGLLADPPKSIVPRGPDETPKAVTKPPPDVLAELTAAGGQGRATIHLVVGESGEVIETRYVPPAPGRAGESRPPLDAYGAWAAELGRLWRFEPPTVAPYSFILDLSHIVHDTATTYEWKLRKTGRLVHTAQPPPAAVAGSQAGNAKVVRVGEGMVPPKRIQHVDPVYPPDAQANRVQGTVVVEATIGTDGSVTDARILKSIPALDQAALDAVLQWKYTPTLLNGEPVVVVMTVTVNFTLA
ncbi:MAG: energy transducer TonB [Vicinamibacteraceae bacterium]